MDIVHESDRKLLKFYFFHKLKSSYQNLKIIQYTLYSITKVQLTCLLFIDFRLNFKN